MCLQEWYVVRFQAPGKVEEHPATNANANAWRTDAVVSTRLSIIIL
jgi:hypothetical protein